MKKLLILILISSLLYGCNGEEGESILTNKVEETTEVIIKETREFETHIEVDMIYPTTDTTLGGTLYLPQGVGPHPVILFQFGSNAWERENALFNYEQGSYYAAGIGIFVYDRRGLGESGGVCCDSNIPLLGQDVLAGVNALILYPFVDPIKIGLSGFSQGGWVLPYAAARSNNIAFTLIGSGSAISIDEEGLYSTITGDDQCTDNGLSKEQIDDIMADAVPGDYDPREDLANMHQPGYWYYAEEDTSNPVRQSITVLEEIKAAYNKNWQIVLYPNANHEFIIGGGPCDSDGETVNTIDPSIKWIKTILDI